MTSPLDYNQHLLAYLQAWRQLLEASAAMTSALPCPAAPGGIPPAPSPAPPPAPPPPPTGPPADYAQQLFSHLQAWRQYLEQSLGTSPTTTSPPVGSQQVVSEPPEQPGFRSGTLSGTPPATPDLPDEYLERPEYDYGYGIDALRRHTSADQPVNTAFGQKMASVAPDAAPRARVQSLYGNRGAGPSTSGVPTGRDPRRAAPPATSRWWEARQGLRPGTGERPRAEDIIDVPPLQ